MSSDHTLHLAPYRAYDAGLGRWLSRDIVGESGQDGPNLYLYTRSSPINYVDSFGLTSWGIPSSSNTVWTSNQLAMGNVAAQVYQKTGDAKLAGEVFTAGANANYQKQLNQHITGVVAGYAAISAVGGAVNAAAIGGALLMNAYYGSSVWVLTNPEKIMALLTILQNFTPGPPSSPNINDPVDVVSFMLSSLGTLVKDKLDASKTSSKQVPCP